MGTKNEAKLDELYSVMQDIAMDKLKSHVPSKYFGHPTFPVVPEPRSQICQLYGLASSNRVDPQGQVPFGGNYAPPILDLLDLRDNKILRNPGLALYDYRFGDPKG